MKWHLGLTSIFVWGFILLLHGLEAEKSLNIIGNTMPILLVLFSYPHLLISYKYAYFQNRNVVFKNWKNLILAPTVLLGTYLAAGLAWSNPIGSQTFGPTMFSLVFNLFILGSGWHAMRQAYGIIIIYSKKKKFIFTNFERKILLLHMYGIFFIDFININLAGTHNRLFGLDFSPLGFTTTTLHLSYIFSAATGVQLLYSLTAKRSFPPSEALITLLALYLWALPCFFLPEFTIFAPNIFHSLQYFAILYTVEKPKSTEGKSIVFWLKKWFLWTALGVILIKFLPSRMDQIINVTHQQSIGFFAFSFFTFFNIHHYFIDSCIWKSNSGSNLLKIVTDGPVPSNLDNHLSKAAS